MTEIFFSIGFIFIKLCGGQLILAIRRKVIELILMNPDEF
jgi:hypothetical protein